MEHLPIHLPSEAKIFGPVQYRWMHPIERLAHVLIHTSFFEKNFLPRIKEFKKSSQFL